MIYLDHAATTPVAPEVVEAMRPHLTGPPGNASSLHAAGRRARAAVEDARDRVAHALGVAPLEVVFTGGGTEADNLAVKGIAVAAAEALPPGRQPHVVTTAIEHHAVLESAEWLAHRAGFELTVVAPGRDGIVPAERVLAAVSDETVLVSVMAANNELGTLQPLGQLGPALAARGVALHTDAVQALGKIPLDLAAWQPTATTITGHKINGLTGTGALLLRRDVAAEPVLHGGGQERGVRSGTLDVAGIVGFATAVELAVERQQVEHARLRSLRDRLLDGLLAIDDVTLNGDRHGRLPHNAHVAIGGCDGEALLLALDAAGVCVSTGSACQSGAAERSHVLDAIAARRDAAHLRFSLGLGSSAAEVDEAITITADAIAALRAGSAAAAALGPALRRV